MSSPGALPLILLAVLRFQCRKRREEAVAGSGAEPPKHLSGRLYHVFEGWQEK